MAVKPAPAAVEEIDALDVGVMTGLVGYHLRRAGGAFAANFHAALAGTDMRQALFGILAVVARYPQIQQGEVGRLLGIQRPNMVALINELTDRRLVERRPAAKDRRAVALALTPQGAEMLRACYARIQRHEDHMLADLTADERAVLIDLLVRIAAKG